MSDLPRICPGCRRRQEIIDQLTDRNERLQKQVEQLKLNNVESEEDCQDSKTSGSDSIEETPSMSVLDDDSSTCVLSFLPLDQKIKFESVCQQWSRCVYKSVDRLVVDANDRHLGNASQLCHVYKGLDKDLDVFKRYECDKDLYLNSKIIKCLALQQLLKKCPFVETIEFRGVFITDDVWSLVSCFCTHLKRLRLKKSSFNTEEVLQFLSQFGYRFSSFDLANKQVFFDRIHLIPNLAELNDSHLLDQTKFSKLIDCYHTKMKTIDVRNSINLRIEEISRCQKLTSLSLNLTNSMESFGKIAENCLKLKNLNLIISINKENYLLVPNLMTQLAKLANLKRLTLTLNETRSIDKDEVDTSYVEHNQFYWKNLDQFLPHLNCLTLHLKSEQLLTMLLEGIFKIKHLTWLKIIVASFVSEQSKVFPWISKFILENKTLRTFQINAWTFPSHLLVDLVKKNPKLDVFVTSRELLKNLDSMPDNLYIK